MNTLKKIFLTTALVATCIVSAQVKIGDNVTSINASSALEIESTNKGLLFPRVALTSTTSFAPLSAHVAGMTVYNTATTGDVTPGMYTDNGSEWVRLGGSSSSALSITVPTTDNYTVLSTDSVIYRNLTATGIITFPSSLPAGKVFYVANLSATSDWNFSPAPVNTGVAQIYAGYSHMVVTLGGGQILVVSGN
jgi:hypothetical protein